MPMPDFKFTNFQPNGLWPTQQGTFLGGRSTPLKSWQFGAVTFTAAAVGAASISEQAITVTGATVNDLLLAAAQGAPTANVGLMGAGRVSAANTFQARYINPTAGSLTPPASQVIFFGALQIQ